MGEGRGCGLKYEILRMGRLEGRGAKGAKGVIGG